MNRNILDFSLHGSIVFYRLSYHGNSKLEYACFLRIRIVTVFYLKFNFFSERRNTVFSRGEFNLFFGFSLFFKFWWLELLWKFTKQINGKIIRMQQKKRHGKQKLAARHRINTDVVMIEKIILIKCGWQWRKINYRRLENALFTLIRYLGYQQFVSVTCPTAIIRLSIWDVLRYLVPFVQIKKPGKHPWIFAKSNTPCFFHAFKIAQMVPNLTKHHIFAVKIHTQLLLMIPLKILWKPFRSLYPAICVINWKDKTFVWCR